MQIERGDIVRRFVQFQIPGLDLSPFTHHDGALDFIFQFANITRPAIGFHGKEGILAETARAPLLLAVEGIE